MSALLCRCGSEVDERLGLPCPNCMQRISDEQNSEYQKMSLWGFRIAALIFMNVLGFLDRTLTLSAISKSNMSIEQNPFAKLTLMNPWLHMCILVFLSVFFGLLYVRSTKKSNLKLDIVLIVIEVAYLLLIANNIVQLAGLS